MENWMIGDMLKYIESTDTYLPGPGGMDERVIMILNFWKDKDKPLSLQSANCKRRMGRITRELSVSLYPELDSLYHAEVEKRKKTI